MNTIKITVEIEKKLALPVVDRQDEDTCDCFANSCALDCSSVQCENCIFDARNYKTLLEQQKGE